MHKNHAHFLVRFFLQKIATQEHNAYLQILLLDFSPYKEYDTFGNLVRLPRNQGKSQQKSLEIKKSGFTSEITSCHQILFEIHVKS